MSTLVAISWAISWRSPKMTKSQDVLASFVKEVCWPIEVEEDGGQFFDTFRTLVISAINTALDERLELED